MESVHDLTAPYALDALDDTERREYEEHLSSCDECREELAQLRETATALAFAVESPSPPPELRDRILAAADSDGAKVIPFRSRAPFRVAAGLAAAAACLAVGLGIWATSLSRSLDREREARSELTAVLADPAARDVRLQRADGRVVVDRSGRAALIVRDLTPAPSGKTYEAWVIEGNTPRPAALFRAERGRVAVVLSRSVPEGAVVAVTLERAGGVDAPTQDPLFSAAT